jgi:Tfp pilus assembly protein PilO
MIKLPRNFFKDLSTTQYKEYLKLLPKMDDKNTQSYTMLGFTLIALSFLGIFAIYPTLSTITELKKTLADLQFLNQQLEIKAQNLSTLQGKYQSLEVDLPVVLQAIPETPEVPKFIAQINALLSESGLKATDIRTYGVELTKGRNVSSNKAASFVFSLEAEGSYDDMLSFIRRLNKIDRIITLEQISIGRKGSNNAITLSLRGRGYFKP